VITMYAIPNCDTVKKARNYLEQKKVSYEFVDFKKTLPTKDQIERWQTFMGELPVNKKGLTYKKVKDEYEALTPKAKIDFIIQNTSMIKRPILEKTGKTIAMGFDPENYDQLKF
jgi:arsenate reductase